MWNKNIIRLTLITGSTLLIPLFGNMYIEGWNWSPNDFVFAFILIFSTGLAYQLAARKMAGNTIYKAAIGIALAASFLLIWVNAAVGIIGDSPINMMYPGVVLVGIIGAIIARLEPRGMSRALIAMAIAQITIPVIALIIGTPDFAPGILRVFILTSFFVTAFVGSALLFRRAER